MQLSLWWKNNWILQGDLWRWRLMISIIHYLSVLFMFYLSLCWSEHVCCCNFLHTWATNRACERSEAGRKVGRVERSGAMSGSRKKTSGARCGEQRSQKIGLMRSDKQPAPVRLHALVSLMTLCSLFCFGVLYCKQLSSHLCCWYSS